MIEHSRQLAARVQSSLDETCRLGCHYSFDECMCERPVMIAVLWCILGCDLFHLLLFSLLREIDRIRLRCGENFFSMLSVSHISLNPSEDSWMCQHPQQWKMNRFYMDRAHRWDHRRCFCHLQLIIMGFRGFRQSGSKVCLWIG